MGDLFENLDLLVILKNIRPASTQFKKSAILRILTQHLFYKFKKKLKTLNLFLILRTGYLTRIVNKR